MSRLVLLVSVLVVLISIVLFNSDTAKTLLQSSPLLASLLPLFSNTSAANTTSTITNITTPSNNLSPSMLNPLKATMSKPLRHAKITPHRSSARGHADHGWLNTYHSFSFADWYDPRFTHFGSLRVLNEDRVRPGTGFPTHPHRDFEIFSYILSGELTHRDSMLRRGAEDGAGADKFYRMRRGDVQFTTGGTGIAHSEMNEHGSETVHFLQIWALPWRRGLMPRYHTRRFEEQAKREGFVKILSPLKGGEEASAEEERRAEPVIEGTIPIHADFVMGAGIIAPPGEGKEGGKFEWEVGAGLQEGASKRKVYVHLPMTKGGKAKVKIDGREDAVLEEGDGAFVDAVNKGDKLVVESVGEADAEVVVLDSNA